MQLTLRIVADEYRWACLRGAYRHAVAKLRVAGGGVVFTTIQKFMPAEQGDRNAVLSDRRNIVHRVLAQVGERAGVSRGWRGCWRPAYFRSDKSQWMRLLQTPDVSDRAPQLVDNNPTTSRIVGMPRVKVSTTLDAASVDEAKALVGERGFSRFLNESLAMRLQRVRLEKLLDEMVEEFGPIPDEARAWVEGQEWPR